MNASLNSRNDSATTTQPRGELAADLSLNHDEALDMGLALTALGGLRHSAACDAAERSQRRYDDRNHRLHEARMRAFGLEGDEEPKPETEDMSQQVLIRSPIHNHYHYPKSEDVLPPPAQPTPSQPATPSVQPSGLSNLAKAAIVGTGLLGATGVGASIYALMNRGADSTTINQITEGDAFGVGLVPPGPPQFKSGK